MPATPEKLRVLSVFGTRPDTIKMAPVVHALGRHEAIDHLVCVTAQHRKMLDDLLVLFGITPDYDLDIMSEDQTLTEITTRVLTRMEGALAEAKPEVVLVHGDTTTSSAAALASFYAGVPVGHVEAGLRTRNPWLPYPEEMNRRITGTIASFHFSPTSLAREHLLLENVPADDVFVTGNTVIDAFAEAAQRDDLPLPPRWDELDPNRPTILVTAHRRENHPHMHDIAEALRDIATLPQAPQLYWPVHPSPHVAPVAKEVLTGVPGRDLGRSDRLRANGRRSPRQPLYSDRLRRSSGRGAVYRQTGAGDARRNGAARRPARRHARAHRAPARADRRVGTALARGFENVRAHGARGQSLR